MKVISINVNGIRAAARKGMFEWLEKQAADVVCLQELKAMPEQLTDAVFSPPGYHRHLFSAEKKGYSGVGIYSKKAPDKVIKGLGFPLADEEGRYIEAQFGDLSVVSLYLPSGSSGEARQACKFDFLARYEKILAEQQSSRRRYIICGDWNIVHKAIDIKNFKSNQKTSGCLPEERAWLDDVLTNVGFVDAFRIKNQLPDQYTWWSNRGQAWANNVGWRIDYQIVSPSLGSAVKQVDIYKEQRFSDHAPLIVEYDI